MCLKSRDDHKEFNVHEQVHKTGMWWRAQVQTFSCGQWQTYFRLEPPPVTANSAADPAATAG